MILTNTGDYGKRVIVDGLNTVFEICRINAAVRNGHGRIDAIADVRADRNAIARNRQRGYVRYGATWLLHIHRWGLRFGRFVRRRR